MSLLFARQPPANAHRFSSLEEEAAAVVQQFPRRAEQLRRAFAGQPHFRRGRAGVAGAIDFDREAVGDAPYAARSRKRTGHRRRSADPHPG